MCREGAWAELTARVTFMMGIQSRMPGYKNCKTVWADHGTDAIEHSTIF